MNFSKDKLLDYLHSFFSALIVFLLLYVFLWPISIEGFSMTPSMENGDRVFISRALCYAGFFDRGDIIMAKVYYDPGKKYIVKRIAGVPGDLIKIEDGNVYVNDVLTENAEGFTQGNLELKLGDGQYFLLGDNRAQSYDSRNFGALDKKDIVGKVIFRWYPLNNIRTY